MPTLSAAFGSAATSNTLPSAALPSSPYTYSPAGSATRLTSPTSAFTTAALSDASRAGSKPSQRSIVSISTKRPPSLDTTMSSYTSTVTSPPPARSASSLAKIHRRTGSNTSLPGTPSSLNGGTVSFPTPYATYEEPFPEWSPAPSPASTPKIKPYLRKISAAKEDRNRIDLSKSMAENDRLAGLGIQDFSPRSVADVTFARAERRQPHTRTTSVGSNVSSGSVSGSYKPSQTFVHPMRQVPRPYTPPLGNSSVSSFQDEEASEREDVVDDEFKLGHGFRTRRSMSISSTQPTQPTPLSQSHTVEDLGAVPKLTSPSLTSLSIKSNRSGKSSKSRPLARSRRNTNNSTENNATSPSSRTSFDKALSFVSKKSDTDPSTRDERIRAARRKFEQKEAGKDRKLEKESRKRQENLVQKEVKREERERRRSETATTSSSSLNTRPKANSGSNNEKLDSRLYDNFPPAPASSLPVYGREAGFSEKSQPGAAAARHPHRSSADNSTQSGWLRFSTWMQTRMLSCGDTR